MQTLESLNALSDAVSATAAAFNTAVEAAQAASVKVDIRVNYGAPGDNPSPMGGGMIASGVTVTTSLTLPLV